MYGKATVTGYGIGLDLGIDESFYTLRHGFKLE